MTKNVIDATNTKLGCASDRATTRRHATSVVLTDVATNRTKNWGTCTSQFRAFVLQKVQTSAHPKPRVRPTSTSGSAQRDRTHLWLPTVCSLLRISPRALSHEGPPRTRGRQSSSHIIPRPWQRVLRPSARASYWFLRRVLFHFLGRGKHRLLLSGNLAEFGQV